VQASAPVTAVPDDTLSSISAAIRDNRALGFGATQPFAQVVFSKLVLDLFASSACFQIVWQMLKAQQSALAI
jgi:hypothetical protein